MLQMKNSSIKSWALKKSQRWGDSVLLSRPLQVHSSLFIVFWKDFDLERSSSLINELVISSLLCISRELSQLSLTTVSKQLKSLVAVARVLKSESLPTIMSYLTEAE